MRLFRLTVIGVAVSVICCPPAHAYVDPGTGSVVLQMVIAGALGAAFTLKRFWRKIVERLRTTVKRP